MPRIDELFHDWVDFDIAEYYLACLLGIVKYDESLSEFRRTKGIYVTKNDVGDMLFGFLEKLVEVNIFERNDVLGYRFNKSFNTYWLNPDVTPAINSLDEH